MPSVRGRERTIVAFLLISSSAASGALLGFVLGVLGELADFGEGGDGVAWPAIVGLLVATVVLDRVVAPLSVRRQVPQLWGRIFSARTTAVLYGARLGVGPLTILRTWWWWCAVIAAALAGVWVSVGVGALFGAARIVVMLAVGTHAGAMRGRERLAMWSGPVVAVALAAFAITAGSDDGTTRRDAAMSTGARVIERRSSAASNDSPMPSTTPADPATTLVADPDLEARLPVDIGAGFQRIDDDPKDALGPLDLDAAAGIEQDEQAERSLLETRHFERGHARAWRHDDGRTAYLAAYRFGSTADAEAYLVDGFITLESRGARVYDVAEPAGGRGFSQAATQDQASEVAHGVAFVRDDVFFLAVVTAPNSAAGPGDAVALARRVADMSEPASG